MRTLGLSLILGLTLASCSSGSGNSGSGSLAGTYTGYMQASGNGSVLKDSLAEVVTVTESNDVVVKELTFTSSAFPTFQATVLSTGSTAVDLDLVGVTKSDVLVQEVGFVQDSSGNWVLVMQIAGGPISGSSDMALLVQYVSYDPQNAPPKSAVEAVDYMDQMFALASFAAPAK
jgi:hypothetical protein